MTSTIKVNTIQNTCGADIIKESSNTITIGASGDTVTLASGASQTGFGRTGTVDWQTSIKTSTTFSASNGEGYFVDTSSNAITANLPAGSAGSIVAFKDYAQNFDTNALTISANGSQKIEGITNDFVLNGESVAVTLVYGDDTKGWQAVNSNDLRNKITFVNASGGTESIVCTNFKVHTFTGPGSFVISCAGSPGGSNSVDYMVIGGGGSGGLGVGTSDRGAGGGAGGFRESSGAASGCYTASPLGSGVSALSLAATSFPVVVGAGGAQKDSFGNGNDGSNSSFSTITSTGGGGGGTNSTTGNTGGSGGGAGGGTSGCGVVGAAGNTPPVSPPQGNNGGRGGGASPNIGGGGGGGATTVGGNAGPGAGGNGGTGATTSINGTPTERAGGGGGDKCAGSSGGGASGPGACQAGTANTGGGGQGGHPSGGGNGSAGGSGIVIIRYKFQ
jgi:hypothetical protein